MPKAPACVAYGTGRPIVLVHGFPFHSGMWERQVAPLRKLGRVVLVDLLGFGANEFEGETPSVLTMDAQADAVAAALDHLEVREPAIFMGFSMGGYVGWSFLRRHRARVDSLVMCNTRAAADSRDAARGRREMADALATKGHALLIETLLPKLLAPDTLARRRHVVDTVSEFLREAPLASVAAAQRGMAERVDSSELARELDIPSLVIVGEHDAISTREELEALAKTMRQAQFVEIPSAGHMTVIENAAATNRALVEFVSSLE